MKRWRVEIRLRNYSTYFDVDADTEEEAKEEALQCGHENLEAGQVEQLPEVDPDADDREIVRLEDGSQL